MYQLPKLGPLLTVDDFKPHSGETYRVDATPEPIGIHLDAVQVGIAPNWVEREPFTLQFSTPWDVLLVEGNYRMKSPRGDLVELYLIPTQTAPGPRRHYHSVFN